MRVFFFAPTLALCLAAHATPAEWVGAKVVTADPERQHDANGYALQSREKRGFEGL